MKNLNFKLYKKPDDEEEENNNEPYTPKPIP